MKTVVFSDRDGTINEDNNYYLGSNPKWRNQVRFLDGVVEGIKLINTIPDSSFFILTNQSGVALKGKQFDELTIERMHEVNRYIVNQLKRQGANVDNYFACPYVDLVYAEKTKRKGIELNEEYVKDGHPDLKPNPGLLEKALKSISLNREQCRIFMIGDRLSGVEMGLRIGGISILVESYKTRELGDKDKVLQLEGRAYVAKNFLYAAQCILENL